MIDLNSVPVHSPDIVARKTGNEYILVPISDNIADMDSVYTLNETGACIWEASNGERTISEIIGILVEEYEIDSETARLDVTSFIESMKNYMILISR